MLDEPPFIVRMCELGSFIRRSRSFPNPKEASLARCRPVVRMQDASNPQAFCDLDKQLRVFDIDHLLGSSSAQRPGQAERSRCRAYEGERSKKK